MNGARKRIEKPNRMIYRSTFATEPIHAGRPPTWRATGTLIDSTRCVMVYLVSRWAVERLARDICARRRRKIGLLCHRAITKEAALHNGHDEYNDKEKH